MHSSGKLNVEEVKVESRSPEPDTFYNRTGAQRRFKSDAEETSRSSWAQKTASKRIQGQTTWTSVLSSLWDLAWPLSGMEILTFTKELIITAYVGHLGPMHLSSLVLALTVYNVTGNAPMLGMVVAMETFCGQAYGARRYNTVGVVLQRALLMTTILNCFCIVAFLGRAESLLLAMGQDPAISRAAAQFTLRLSPCLLMDGVDQCLRRYLASQSVVQPLMFVTFLATLTTPVFLWFFIIRCDYGLDGAAIAWCCAQAISLIGIFSYFLYYNATLELSKRTWSGWSRESLKDWGTYIQVAVPSMVMICLDWWTFEMLVILSGLLPNPDLTMSMMGITFNIHALCFFAANGLSGAASTRVGNELGAGRPRLAWLYTQVSVGVGVACMSLAALMLMLYRQELGGFFTSDEDVKRLTAQAVPSIALSLVGEGANTVLAGVLRGCGRQRIGATVNLGLYWGLGLPFAYFLAFKMGLEAMGLWTGLACTASLQSLYLACVVFRFDWGVEALRAKALIAAGEVDFDVDEELLAEVEGDQDRE